MPNEIFEDLTSGDKFSTPSHIAFAYCYYYYISYLYRYSIYGSLPELCSQSYIKQYFGYSPTYKKIDYIIRKNGVLEELGYIRSIRDYPIKTECERYEINGKQFVDISFVKNSENKSNIMLGGNSNNHPIRTIKAPIKALYREQDAERDGYENGTFFDTSNTHGLSYRVFDFLIRNVGVESVYYFSFLKMKNETHSHLPNFRGGYSADLNRLCEMTKLRRDYLIDLNKRLESLCLDGEPLISIGRHRDGDKNNPNIYTINICN